MPVEIREVVIKTELESQNNEDSKIVNHEDLNQMRNQIMEECRKIIKKEIQKKYRR
ncbi:DUF5908 family protein [Winogradskyella sp.]|uniref:DUF5908 family protein n=1 Tax=Winogradskyella sp. TaxID=1883156 RepID=UPI0025CBA1DF|nr:DUF5908 family protein [Winogradskyella sp.]